jgi:hypothetical protein
MPAALSIRTREKNRRPPRNGVPKRAAKQHQDNSSMVEAEHRFEGSYILTLATLQFLKIQSCRGFIRKNSYA